MKWLMLVVFIFLLLMALYDHRQLKLEVIQSEAIIALINRIDSLRLRYELHKLYLHPADAWYDTTSGVETIYLYGDYDRDTSELSDWLRDSVLDSAAIESLMSTPAWKDVGCIIGNTGECVAIYSNPDHICARTGAEVDWNALKGLFRRGGYVDSLFQLKGTTDEAI